MINHQPGNELTAPWPMVLYHSAGNHGTGYYEDYRAVVGFMTKY